MKFSDLPTRIKRLFRRRKYAHQNMFLVSTVSVQWAKTVGIIKDGDEVL